ncbi:hypothetical protein D9M72_450580 [compost metagenome]
MDVAADVEGDRAAVPVKQRHREAFLSRGAAGGQRSFDRRRSGAGLLHIRRTEGDGAVVRGVENGAGLQEILGPLLSRFHTFRVERELDGRVVDIISVDAEAAGKFAEVADDSSAACLCYREMDTGSGRDAVVSGRIGKVWRGADSERGTNGHGRQQGECNCLG